MRWLVRAHSGSSASATTPRAGWRSERCRTSPRCGRPGGAGRRASPRRSDGPRSRRARSRRAPAPAGRPMTAAPACRPRRRDRHAVRLRWPRRARRMMPLTSKTTSAPGSAVPPSRSDGATTRAAPSRAAISRRAVVRLAGHDGGARSGPPRTMMNPPIPPAPMTSTSSSGPGAPRSTACAAIAIGWASAAASSVNPYGSTARQVAAGTATSSARPPSRCRPTVQYRSQRLVPPRRHARQAPHDTPAPLTTRSPSWNPPTSGADRLDPSDEFVTGDQWSAVTAVADARPTDPVQVRAPVVLGGVRATDAGDTDADQQVARTGDRAPAGPRSGDRRMP